MPLRGGRAAGGKVPRPSAHANAPPGGVRRLALASHGWSAKPFMQCISKAASPFMRRIDKAMSPFTRRTISAVSAANECEGITCLWQVTRNDSDEAERSERSPSGVVSVANDEGLAAAGGQVRPARAAREWKCLASQREVRGERGGPDGRSCTPQAGRP